MREGKEGNGKRRNEKGKEGTRRKKEKGREWGRAREERESGGTGRGGDGEEGSFLKMQT